MLDTELQAVSPLNGYAKTFDDTRLWETSGLVIINIAIPRNGHATLEHQLNSLWQLSIPDAGTCLRASSTAIKGLAQSLTLLGMQKDQCLLVFEPDQQSIEQAISSVHNSLSNVAYLTDQTDSLAVLNVQGALALPALERMCMLDLSRFNATTVARTAIEHSSVIIEMPDLQYIRLYTPRSSANSFLHTITTSLSSVCCI